MTIRNIPSSFLRINDIEFRIPPESIHIVKSDHNASVAALRSATTTKVKTGRRTAMFVVETTIATGTLGRQGVTESLVPWVNSELAPLIIQARKCPFVSIENEKIRKEMLGDSESSENRNMAAVIESISVTSIPQQADAMKVEIVMSWFNYLPYSRNFEFKEEINGESIAVDEPGEIFKEFYHHGTTVNGNLINSLTSPLNTNLEIYFKEYRLVDIEDEPLSNIVEDLSSEQEKIRLVSRDDIRADELDSEKGSESTAQKLEQLNAIGWEQESLSEFGLNSPSEVLLSRYVRIGARSGVSPETADSGELIVENFASALETKTAKIPLLGHKFPTAQFLGAADSSLSFSLFANAEVESETPTETSRKLARLNQALEAASRNATIYNRLSRNDALFVNHPGASLLKYKKYTGDDAETRVALDMDTGRLIEFNPNDMLGCTLESTASRTVRGAPFCSRFTITLSENYRNAESEKTLETDTYSVDSVFEGTLQLVEALVDRADITVTEGTPARSITGGAFAPQGVRSLIFGVGNRVGQSSDRLSRLEFDAATDLVNALNASMNFDPLFAQRYSSIEDVDVKQVLRDREIGLSSRTAQRERGVQLPRGVEVLNSDVTSRVADTVVRHIANATVNETSDPYSSFALATGIAVASGRIHEKTSHYDDAIDLIEAYALVASRESYPDMMIPPSHLQPDSSWYNHSDEERTEEELNDARAAVWERRVQMRNLAENVYNTGELPEKIKEKEGGENYMPADWQPSPSPNASSVLAGEKDFEAEDAQGLIQQPMNEDQQRVAINRAVEVFRNDAYTMRRAMPTFKIFFKEKGLGSLDDARGLDTSLWKNFDDLYDLNAIVDIRLATSEDNPVSLAIIRITNTREDLVNASHLIRRRTSEDLLKRRQIERDSNTIDEKRQRLASLEDGEMSEVILKEGARMELRLGNDRDPNDLEVEFSGRVASISGGDVIEIVCQGDGIELIQELKGVGVSERFDSKSNTQDLIGHLLYESPEVVSFGTNSKQGWFQGIKYFFDAVGGRNILDNIYAPTLFSSWENAKGEFFRVPAWQVVGSVVLTKLTGPIGFLGSLAVGTALGTVRAIGGAWNAFWNGSPYYLYEQTIWEVLQEMTMRHPGTIVATRPYDKRSTLYFGYPDQLYFHRGPSIRNILAIRGERGFFGGSKRRGTVTRREIVDRSSSALSQGNASSISRGSVISRGGTGAIATEQELSVRESIEEDRRSNSVVDPDSIRPFRNYHVIDSDHDIIENSMQVNSDGVYNAMTIAYPRSHKDTNYDGSKGFSSYELEDTVQADDNLYEEFIKRQTLVYHNANKNVVKDMPFRYATSALCKSLSNVYSGKIVILGRKAIRPHDIVFVFDHYNSIYGPVKVGEIVHRFSYDTGWITEIHPKMIVTPAGTTELENIKAMQELAHRSALNNRSLFLSNYTLETHGATVSEDQGKASNLARNLSGPVGNSVRKIVNSSVATIVGIQAFEDINATRKAADYKSAKVLSKAGKLGGSLGKVLGRTLGITVVGMGLDYGVTWYTNWSRTRQPISFLPVTRNGKPWYTGLHGLRNTTDMQAISEFFINLGYDSMESLDAYVDRFRDRI